MTQDKVHTIESLLNSAPKGKGKWLPIPIEVYREQMQFGYFSDMPFYYKSNIAYSLQYLEFQEMLLRDLNLTSVIYTQIVKYFVITVVSIIEMLFFQIAKHERKIKRLEWRLIKAQDKKNYNDKGKIYKKSEVIYEKLETPEETIPTLETLIQIVKDNNYLKSINMAKYKPILKTYRKLRNKVHLSATTSQSENDYNSFDWKVYLRAKILLVNILNDISFGTSKQHPLFTKLLNATAYQIKYYRETNKIIYKWID